MLRKAVHYLPDSRPYLIVSAIAVIIFLPTWYRLAGIWLEFEQVLAHGLATAIIFLGLLLIHPPQNATPTRTSMPPLYLPGALALIVVTLFWGLLELVRIDTLAFLILPVGMITICWALLGFHRALSFLPYVLLLSLSLPIWADIVPALVSLASVVVGTWVRWFGMTALIEGNSITLPYGRILIADGCSGIRYFAISILLAMMTSILNDYRWKGWVITLAAAMLIGLVANWVRITILVFVAYDTNMQSELMTGHETMGWIVFGAFILPALYFSPIRKRSGVSNRPTGNLPIRKTGIIAIIMAILLGPGTLLLTQSTAGQQPPWTLDLAGFQNSQQYRVMPLPISLPESLQNQTWKSGNLWVSLAQSQKTASDGKIVPYIPEMIDRSTWQVEKYFRPGVSIYRNILTRDRVLMAQWFQVGAKSSATYRRAKLLQIPALLTGEVRFALLTIQSPCMERDCDLAFADVERTKELIRAQL